DAPLVLSWSGAHLPGKALPLLLSALSTLSSGIDWRLEILGDGPCRHRWQMLAHHLGIQPRCRWHGWQTRSAALDLMRASHLFVITSLKDLTATVSLEALSLGVPVICLDHCGFADLVTPDCGIKIPLGSARQIARGLAAAITALWTSEPRRRRLSIGALARSKQYSWSAKLNQLDRIYIAAVAKHPHKRQLNAFRRPEI
ncbi:MAG TPA: glycosyltransferase, partial [Edaphobacter sp.]|nr:glycosyltransferase [Edaphobacter sp.]